MKKIVIVMDSDGNILSKTEEDVKIEKKISKSELEEIQRKFTDKIINNISSKLKWKPDKVRNYIYVLWKINKAATLSLILRELAIELDKKYEDHISNCEELYVFSMMDGKIHKVYKTAISNYNNFAAFRTLEDARFACSLLELDIKDMFNNGKKQENKKC